MPITSRSISILCSILKPPRGERTFAAAHTIPGRGDCPLAGEQDKEVESDWERTGRVLKRRPAEMQRVRSHQQGFANAVTFEDRVACQPRNCRRPNLPAHHIGVMAALSLMLPHQTEKVLELDEMMGAGIDHREPAPWRQHSRRLGKILRREDAEHEISGSILNRPFLPQIRDGKSVLRPLPRGSTRSFPPYVEAQPNDRRIEHRGNPGKVIPSAGPRINHAPTSGNGASAGSLHARGDRCRDGVEMTPLQERLAVPQLLGVVTTRRWKAAPGAKEIDIARAREIEAMTVAAGECARRGCQVKPTNRAAQQPIAGTEWKRRHGAAPPVRRSRSVSFAKSRLSQIDFSAFPKVAEWSRNCAERPAARAARQLQRE